MGLIRLGTGRDAADVSFATIFGAVKASPPVIGIEGIEDAGKGINLPSACVDALSTDVERAPRNARSLAAKMLADAEPGQMAAIGR
jgi:hypothetical protein